MQIVAQALLVLRISHGSALALGAVSLAQALAFFAFALFGGAVADRVDKRRLLAITQSASMGFAALLGLLTALGVVETWMVVVLAFLNGTALSFDQPTRAALVPELVPSEDLFGALSLQSIVFTGASAVGPALAGLALGSIGLAGNFFANALSFLPVLGALVVIRPAPSGVPARTPSPRAIEDSLRVVAGDAALPGILAIHGALLFLGPSPALLLPVMARDVLHVDPTRLGVLFAASGIGALLGGLILASLGDPRHKGRLVVAAAIGWAIALTAFVGSRAFVLSLSALLGVGLCQAGVSATTITLLQTRVPKTMRGRVMSLNTLLLMGVRPLGDFVAAAAIAAVGAPRTSFAAAALVALVAIGVGLRSQTREA